MPRGFDRTERIADNIQKTLAQIILEEMQDSRFRLVTITGVQLARDLSFAKIFVSVLKEEEITETVEALNNAAKRLRFSLAQSIKLRIVPELRFVYDDSTARGFRISSLIDSAIKKTDKTKDS